MKQYPFYLETESTGKSTYTRDNNRLIQECADLANEKIMEALENTGAEIKPKMRNHLSNIVAGIFAYNSVNINHIHDRMFADRRENHE